MSRTPDPDKDSESVQSFLTTTEGAFGAHPLFVNATDEELDNAGEVFSHYLIQLKVICSSTWYANRKYR